MSSDIEHHRIDELDIAVLRRGGENVGRPPLVFLHGLGDSSIITFERIATHPALADYPTVLIDLPGFGHSTAPDSWPATMEHHAEAIAILLERLGLERSPIVGHSMGGSLALMVATRRPGNVSRLILAEPLLKREHSELAASLAKRNEQDFVSRGFDMLLRATRRQAARGDKAAQGFLVPLQHASPAIMHRSAASLLADRSPSFLSLLETLPMGKTLLIGARTDVDPGVIPPGVFLLRIPEAGHSMMSENPDAFASAIACALQAAEESM
jgi:pimeloyl-ACP methyl ester carboxylesterase